MNDTSKTLDSGSLEDFGETSDFHSCNDCPRCITCGITFRFRCQLFRHVWQAWVDRVKVNHKKASVTSLICDFKYRGRKDTEHSCGCIPCSRTEQPKKFFIQRRVVDALLTKDPIIQKLLDR
jgi:hypothetical protein